MFRNIAIAFTLFCASSTAFANTQCPSEDANWRVNTDASVMRLMVFRASGGLSKLGHDHVVALPPAEGRLKRAENLEKAKARLRFNLADIELDSDVDRAWSGYFPKDKSISDKDKAGTLKNLSGPKLLDAENYPDINVDISKLKPFGDKHLANVTFHVKDKSIEKKLVFSLDHAANLITVRGDFVLAHADLGLKPFSVLGGAIKVDDPIAVHFSLQFESACPA